MAISEEEVKKSFARVKEDILQLKRSANKQAFAGEETGKALSNLLQKDEFYAFIKRLGSKIEELENQFPSKSDTEDVQELASELREEISSLRKAVERKDELAGEVQQVRKLQGKVLELEGLSVPKPEFSKEVARLKAELSSIKSEASASSSELSSSTSSLASSLAKLTKDLTDFGARLNSLATRAVVKDDISSFTERVESSSQEMSRGFESLKRDFDKKTHEVDKNVSFVGSFEEKLSSLGEKLASAETAIATINESLSRKFVDKNNLEKSLTELRSKLGETRQLVEFSMSEVNLDDYVTKRSLKQQISSLPDSVSSSVSSALSSRIETMGEQLKSLKEQLDSAQKDAGRHHARDISKLREEIGRSSSEFARLSDFASKLDRLQRSSEDSWNDAKKEMKRQRELLEERLRLLESHYRSSSDSLKAELDELRGQIKALSKADAAAKAEMAKISTSAAKAAAKSAADILKEVEEEKEPHKGEEGLGKGMSPLALSLIIITVLIIGSIAFVMLKGPGKETAGSDALLNLTQVQPAPKAVANATKEAKVVKPTPAPTPPPQAAAPTLPPNASTPQPPPVTKQEEIYVPNVSQASSMVDNDQLCKAQLECKKRSEREYWFDCYYDASNQNCRCYVGSIDRCPHLKKAEEGKNLTNITAAPEAEAKGKAVSLWYYFVVAFVVLAVLFFSYKTLFAKEGKEEKPAGKAGGRKEPKAEKPARKQERDKEKGEKQKPAKAESEGEDVIDLEEFFEKK